MNNKRRLIMIVATILIIVIFALLAGWFWLNSYDSIRQKNTIPEESENSYTPPLSEQYLNTLIIGVDQDGMADVILVASVNFFSELIIITSIPRDTFVAEQDWAEPEMGLNHLSFANYAGMKSDNGNYHSGAATTAYWVEKLFGIKIHEYVLITYESFVVLVDAIGGVEIEVDPAFANVRHHIFGKVMEPLPIGLQLLDGEQTFAYSHFRGYPHNPRIPEPGSTTEDGDRIRRNQRLLKTVYEQVRAMKLPDIIELIQKAHELTYNSFTIWNLTNLAPKIYKAEFDEIVTINLPGEMVPRYEKKAGEEVYYYMVDFDTTKALLSGLGLIWE